MKKLSTAVSATLFALPFIASAQGGPANLGFIRALITSIGSIVNSLIPLLIALALAAFFYGLVRMILAGGKGAAEGKQLMIWGLVALFVMVSVWGIINLAQQSLGVPDIRSVSAPSVQTY